MTYVCYFLLSIYHSLIDVLQSNENEASIMNRRGHSDGVEDTKLPVKTPTLQLECIEGCHKGLTVPLSGELIIGQDPSRGMKGKKQPEVFEIEDEEASDQHAKLVLNNSGTKKKPMLTVRVTDMKSENGTFVNGKIVSGKGKQAFVKDKIKVGNCVFCIRNA